MKSMATPDHPATAPGSVAITWLRQAGFVLEGPAATVAIDPFLTDIDGQLVPPAVQPEALG